LGKDGKHWGFWGENRLYKWTRIITAASQAEAKKMQFKNQQI